jgi:hypothetical protein
MGRCRVPRHAGKLYALCCLCVQAQAAQQLAEAQAQAAQQVADAKAAHASAVAALRAAVAEAEKEAKVSRAGGAYQ